MSPPVVCPNCSAPISPAQFATAQFTACGDCGTPLLARAFPALLRPAPQGVSGERITDSGQAACFYHPHKTAHVPCDACGRFVCALCDVELHGQHLCPACIEAGRRKGSLTTLESRRMLWDNVALAVAVLPPLLCLWPAIVGAPAAIFLAIFGWRKPRSVAPRFTRLRLTLAIVVAVLALVGIGALIYFLKQQGGGATPFSMEPTIQE